jgi:heme/copper-type cytochrome/quinol oxidase subunit 3
MSLEIPYASQPRPDTGVSNATLGMWLFIASEVMLFGSLFSSYALLRIGAAAWPDQQATLLVTRAALNTVVLVLSSVAIVVSASALRRNDGARFRVAMLLSIALGMLFLIVKGTEYATELNAGLRPATGNFLGLYFTMTGLHALHVLGGLAVNAWLWRQSRTMWRDEPVRFASRVRTAALYWNFIDVIWLAMFVTLYLL